MLIDAAKLSIVKAFTDEISYFTITDTNLDPATDLVSFDDTTLGGGHSQNFILSDEDKHVLTDSGEVKVNCTIEEDDGNGYNWTEIGLYDNHAKLICREIFATPFQKTSLRTASWHFMFSFNHALLKAEACI